MSDETLCLMEERRKLKNDEERCKEFEKQIRLKIRLAKEE